MNDEKLKQLLRQTDAQTRLLPLDTTHLSSAVHRRLHRRKVTQRTGMLTAAAMIIIVCLFSHQKYQSWQKDRHIARLQQEVMDLKRRTEQTLVLVQQMSARQDQLDAEYRLASYQNPIKQQVDEAAFILVYQADRMVKKYNDKETAIEYYNQVIKRFGDTPSAETARQRLKQIEKQNQSNQI